MSGTDTRQPKRDARDPKRSLVDVPHCPMCGVQVPQWPAEALAHGEGGDYACESCADEYGDDRS